jgi:hypothetical protein
LLKFNFSIEIVVIFEIFEINEIYKNIEIIDFDIQQNVLGGLKERWISLQGFLILCYNWETLLKLNFLKVEQGESHL